MGQIHGGYICGLNNRLKTAAQLKKKETGVVKELPQGTLRVKLMEMGCLPGETIRLLYKAPLGDPLCFEVSGYALMMRWSEATQIVLEP